MLVKVSVCQLRIGEGLSLAEKIHLFKQRPDFVCLPEYYFMPNNSRDYSVYASKYNENLRFLERMSSEIRTTLIGGTVVEKNQSGFFNTCYVFDKGEKIASYRKRNPTENEKKKGIIAGNKYIIFEIDKIKIAVLICADVLNPEHFEKLGELGANIIFIPTISPLLPMDRLSDKEDRDRNIFLRGAKLSGAYVVKTCGLGTVFGNQLNGRSLIAAPWDIIWKVSPDSEQQPCIQSMILDLDELHEFRKTAIIRQVVGQIKYSE